MTILRLIHAGICALFGFSAFFAFMVLKNYPSALLGLIAGITDSIGFFLHYLHRKGQLRQWYEQSHLRIICRYSIIVATVGLLCLGYFITIQVMYKKAILPIPDSCAISIVWAFVALRSGIFLIYYSILYQRPDDPSATTGLLNDEAANPVDEGREEIGPDSD